MPKNDQSTKHWWSSASSNKEAETKTKSQAAPAETKTAPPKTKPVKKWMSKADFETYKKSFESCKKRVQDSKDALVDGGSLSLDSIKDFNKNLCDTDQVVVEFIQKLKVNIFESKPVRKLIDDYFRVSLQTLELLSELENCLRDAGNSHLSLRLAAKKFENKKYGEMHEKVGNFKASGDPFKVKFWVMYVKLCDKQIALFDKVMEIHLLVNRPPPLKPKVIPKKKGHLVIHEQLQDDDDDKLNTETIEEHDIESEEEKEEDDEEEEEGGEGEGEGEGEEEGEGELDNRVVIAEFENFRIGALSWTEKITSLSALTDTAIEDEAAKSVVDELKSEVSKFQGDIDQMVDHTRKCKDQILSGREKVLGLIKTSA